jgi:hypothetical protein
VTGIMEYYLLGVIAAFLINVVRLLITIMTGFSQRIKNLKKIGGYFNITKGQITKEKPSIAWVVFYFVDALFITPLLSWLYVGYYLFGFVKARINKTELPEKLKEINFKLSSADLPKDLVKECLNEISRFYSGQDADFRNPYDDEYYKDTYSITSGDGRDDWNVKLELDKSNRTFVINARDPDFGEHIDTSEYKFEGTELWARTIEAKHKYPNKVEYEIKNCVVLEQEYRERQKDGLFSSPEEVDERVQKLFEEVEWGKHNNPAIRYFILFRHADVLNDAAVKKFFQSEYERITYGFKRLEERVNSLGFSIGKQEYITGNTIMRSSEDTSEENLVEIRDILHGDGMARFNISYAEFSNKERLVDDLKLYLSKL